MDRHDQSNQTYSNSVRKIETAGSKPYIYAGYQPPNLPMFSPAEALRTGTLWKPFYAPYFNLHEQAIGYNPAMYLKRPHGISVDPLPARKNEELPEKGIPPENAYQMIQDEIMLDGKAQLNLATFVTTWMDSSADRLYADSFNKNLVDKDEYPHTTAIEKRCVRILADLWHSPNPESSIGVSTSGSSEACMLGGLALKRRWQIARKKQGKPIDRPNIIFSSAVQVVWKKFVNYWEIEPRYVNITPDDPCMSPEDVLAAADENTIGVVPTFGVTYTGLYEPVAAISKALDELQSRTGLDIPIHVDAASGGFIAPFIQPDLVWDFQLTRVKSINVSGHKYGLVYPGIGWVIWREAEDLPEELIFRVSYLGGRIPTLGLNFSRPSSQVLLQYYNFFRLGKSGYYEVQKDSQAVAHFLSNSIQEMGPFKIFTDGTDIPVLTWMLIEGHTSNWNLYDLSRQLRTFGWQVPAYPLPPDMENVTIMRVVVRNGLSMDMARFFLRNLKQSVSFLDSLEGPLQPHAERHSGFHH